MQFKGNITFKGEKIFVGANSTPKLSIVLEEETTRDIKDSMVIDFIGDQKVGMIESYNVWDVITVSFNSRASEYNGRYFQNLTGWRVEGGSGSAPAAPKPSNDDMDIPF